MIQSSYAWFKHFNIGQSDIIDPDGWDRHRLGASMIEPLSEDEFLRRLSASTTKLTPAIVKVLKYIDKKWEEENK